MPEKFVVGRITGLPEADIEPPPLDRRISPHSVRVHDHQRRLAVLISAAYLYKEERTEEALKRLREAAISL